MKVAIIATGTELLKGTTVNTNLAFIGEQLTNIGLVPSRCLVIGDSRNDLLDALRETVNIADVVIATGGLGPTRDDITRDVVCEFFGLTMHEDRQLMDELRQLWAKRGRGAPPPELFNQAMIPEHATILKNEVGTAPGLWIENEQSGAKKIVILLPGPPSELEPMFTAEVIPKLNMLAKNTVFTESFMIAGTAELLVQKQVEPLMSELPLELAYCASAEGVRVFFSSSDKNLIQEKAAEAKLLFGTAVLKNNLLSLVPEISERLREKKYLLATAESCTGGMIAAAVTDLAGSSDIFAGAIVAYSNRIKETLLGVPAEILQNKGAVSAECAEAMVNGACERLGALAGIAVTGIAGPGGGTPQKPVGLVYIAAKLNNRVEVRECNFRGNRTAVRNRTRATAFLLLRKLLIEENT